MKRLIIAIALLLSACTQAPVPQAPNAADNDPLVAPSAGPPATEHPDTTSAGSPANPNDAGVAAPLEQGAAHPCEVQDGKTLPSERLRAVGTEPFWAADIQGRCVTYKTPENQVGTRVWTKFEGTARSGSWSGSLDGKPFVLKTSPDPKCSDGMSDTVYPISVALTVGGEQRGGCARP